MNTGRVVLVTGAAGQVGSEVVARLTSRGNTVIALVHSRFEIMPTMAARSTRPGCFPATPDALTWDWIRS